MIAIFSVTYFAERTFGIKAKPRRHPLYGNFDFAERTFGIKAKLPPLPHEVALDFAERTFGIKAKRGGRHGGRH